MPGNENTLFTLWVGKRTAQGKKSKKVTGDGGGEKRRRNSATAV